MNKTWHYESLIVLLILIITAFLSKKGAVEWLGVIAVFFTFMHASVAERLAEAEEKRVKKMEKVYVDCYPKLKIYFYIKEIFWFSYFIFIGAWSAVAGVCIFLLYPLWRKFWRAHHPL